MIALAELRRRQGKRDAVRLLLQDAREIGARGQYRLHLADIENTRARLATDEGDLASAVAAATEAYRLAWCDGPPFAYTWALTEAAMHLYTSGAAPPRDLPPFDASAHPPMPQVEINPADEWHLGGDEHTSTLIGSFAAPETEAGGPS
jgi:hypothetical protein